MSIDTKRVRAASERDSRAAQPSRCSKPGFRKPSAKAALIARKSVESSSCESKLDESTPDHSTISRTRRLIDLETHREVFTWVLQLLAQQGLLKAGTIAVDATTLEANAALRSIVRRDSGASYEEFLRGLAAESGIETPSREQLAKLDKKRKNKGSNKDWTNLHDPDAKIAQMKDGRTHLAHKAEHAVDLETGALLALTVQGADLVDTTTVAETITAAAEQVAAVAQDQQANEQLSPQGLQEVVADKGYHSNDVLTDLTALIEQAFQELKGDLALHRSLTRPMPAWRRTSLSASWRTVSTRRCATWRAVTPAG